jgi:hypothetical protein
MAFYNFGDISNAMKSANIAYLNRNTSPISSGIGIMSHNTGDIAGAQIAQLKLAGNTTDFIWGASWGSSKYRVGK